jgi:hypothetical protein
VDLVVVLVVADSEAEVDVVVADSEAEVDLVVVDSEAEVDVVVADSEAPHMCCLSSLVHTHTASLYH